MAIRITPDLDNTKALLETVLTHVLCGETRVAFLVPAGQSSNVLARIRTMISRTRNRVQSRGKKPKRFRLNSSVHHETHAGVRMECIVLWKSVSENHMMTELLEDVLSNG